MQSQRRSPASAVALDQGELIGAKADWGGVANGPCLACPCDLGDRVEDIIACSRIGAGDDAPTAARPVLDQRLARVIVGNGITDRPDIGGGEGNDSFELVDGRTGIRAADHAPVPAIPVLRQRFGDADASRTGDVKADGPNVTGRDAAHTQELVVGRPFIRAGNHAPPGAIPVLGQCSGEGLVHVLGVTNRPDVVLRDHFEPHEDIIARTGSKRTGDDLPAPPVPLLRQCLRGATVAVVEGTDRPDIGRGDRCYSFELIDREVSLIRAGYNGPACCICYPAAHQQDSQCAESDPCTKGKFQPLHPISLDLFCCFSTLKSRPMQVG